MIRDPFYRIIVERLGGALDPDLFERCAADLLRDELPTLVPIRGGADAGMDGAVADGTREAYPLISTTGRDVIGNLTRNLDSYMSNGGERRRMVHDRYLKDLEKAAKVPYDLSAGRAVDGLSPKVHRLMSLGHDPILAFIFGVMDVISGTGTYIDKHGDLRRIATSMSPKGLIAAFLKVFLHLLSDVFTSAGIQPPFFTLLQLAKTKSPFVLGPSGERVTWTNVARYMYTHGYDLRHFATMGIVPASIEMIVRGWWLCKGFESNGEIAPTKAKLTSMLMLARLIATSGNLLKTGVIFGMNPSPSTGRRCWRSHPLPWPG